MTLRIDSNVETLILSDYAIVDCKKIYFSPYQHALNQEWIKLLFQPKNYS